MDMRPDGLSISGAEFLKQQGIFGAGLQRYLEWKRARARLDHHPCGGCRAFYRDEDGYPVCGEWHLSIGSIFENILLADDARGRCMGPHPL